MQGHDQVYRDHIDKEEEEDKKLEDEDINQKGLQQLSFFSKKKVEGFYWNLSN